MVWRGNKSSVMGSRYIAKKLPHPARGQGTVLFTYEEFRRLWEESRQTLIVFLHNKDLRRLGEQVTVSPKIISQVGDMVIVSNH